MVTSRQSLTVTKAAAVLVGLASIAFLALSLRSVNLLYEANRLLLEKPPRTAEAASKARAAGRISPGQADELLEVGSRVAAGQDTKAIALLHASLAKEPDNVSGWLLLGRLLISLGRDREGRQALRRARALSGDPGRWH